MTEASGEIIGKGNYGNEQLSQPILAQDSFEIVIKAINRQMDPIKKGYKRLFLGYGLSFAGGISRVQQDDYLLAVLAFGVATICATKGYPYYKQLREHYRILGMIKQAQRYAKLNQQYGS